jgi:hypothetical protein
VAAPSHHLNPNRLDVIAASACYNNAGVKKYVFLHVGIIKAW